METLHHNRWNNLIFLGHHLIKNHQIVSLEKLSAKELYSIILLSRNIKPTSQNILKIY